MFIYDIQNSIMPIIIEPFEDSSMGGSGRPKTRERIFVEDCQWIDINEIVKLGFTIYPVIAFLETEYHRRKLMSMMDGLKRHDRRYPFFK